MIFLGKELESKPRRGRKRNVNKKVAIGYVRVSTDEQENGPEAQRVALASWCKAQGVKLVAVYEDVGVSGAAPLDERPGLLAAIEDLREKRAGVLLVAKRDRLARDTMTAALVERLAERDGAKVQSADGAGNGDGPEAQLLRTMIDAFAMYERALIKIRTKAALAVKKKRGERVGQVPYGFTLAANGRDLERDPEEQRVVARVRAMRADGKTLQAITDALNDERVPARGGRWHLTSVARMLKREDRP